MITTKVVSLALFSIAFYITRSGLVSRALIAVRFLMLAAPVEKRNGRNAYPESYLPAQSDYLIP